MRLCYFIENNNQNNFLLLANVKQMLMKDTRAAFEESSQPKKNPQILSRRILSYLVANHFSPATNTHFVVVKCIDLYTHAKEKIFFPC